MFAPRPRLILSIVLLHSFLGRSVESQVKTTVSPLELVKTVIHDELNRAGDREVRWRYRLNKQAEGKQEQGSGGNPIGVTRAPDRACG